ncbi:MAG: peptidoglycan-binding protein [Magnetovibrio sp.]|nr:peptidoglycan-binding protein [Magnetovibrio sp.]
MEQILKLRRALSADANVEPVDVLAAKKFLQAQGFYEAPDWGVSEIPDRALFSAIEAFQKSKGLRVDGVMKPLGETEQASQLIQAQKIQSMGRDGDFILAHITPAEAMLLKEKGGAGTINPRTGLLEFRQIGGSNYGRAQHEKARNRAESKTRAANGTQQSGDWDSSRNRSLGYNDFNPGGIFGDKNRNGTQKDKAGQAEHSRALARAKATRDTAIQALKAKAKAKAKAIAYAQVKADANQADHKRRGQAKARGVHRNERMRALNGLSVQLDGKNEDLGVLGQTQKNKENIPNAGINFSDETRALTIRTQTNYGPQLPGRTEVYGPQLPDHTAVYGPPAPSSLVASKGVKFSSNPLTKAEVDPSWISSPEPNVQAQNVVATNDRLAREKQAKLDTAAEAVRAHKQLAILGDLEHQVWGQGSVSPEDQQGLTDSEKKALKSLVRGVLKYLLEKGMPPLIMMKDQADYLKPSHDPA